MPFLDQFDACRLTAVARTRKPRVKRWVGNRNGNSKRRYICHICDCVIDTESNNWHPTKHAEDSIREHRQHHLDQSFYDLVDDAKQVPLKIKVNGRWIPTGQTK